MGATKTVEKEWSHATSIVVMQLDNEEEWQRHAMRTMRQYAVRDGSIELGEWFEENVFPEGGGEFEEAARVMFLENVDWVEVAIHFARKSLDCYKASEDEEASDLVDLAIAECFGEDWMVEPHYVDDHWFITLDNDDETTEVWRVVDRANGPSHGLDFERLENMEERKWKKANLFQWPAR